MKIFDVSSKEKNILLTLFVVSLIIRLVYLLEIINTPFTNYLYLDPKLYYDFASHFFSSAFWTGNESISIPILYPIVIYVAHLFTDSNFTLFIFQAFFSSAAILLIYLTGRNLFDKNVGLISSVVALLFSPYIFYSGLVSYETVEIFLVSFLIFLLSNIENDYEKKRFIFSGLILAFLFLLRESYLFIFLLYLTFILIRNKSSNDLKANKKYLPGAFILGFLIPVFLVLAVNLSISGSFILNSTNSGINFNIANNSDSKAIFIDPSNFTYESDPAGRELASNLENEKFTSSGAQNYWYAETLRDIVSSPVQALGNGVVKILLFFDANDLVYSSMYDADFYRQNYSNLLKLPFISFAAIALLALVGLMIYLKRKESNKFISIFVIGYLIIIFFSFANLRFRLGVTPIFIILASFSIVEIVNSFSKEKFKKLVVPLITVVFIVLINTFFIKKPELNNYDAYFHLAKIAELQERYEEAIYNFNRSILLNDRYSTFLNLGNTFAKKKDFNNALAAYSEAEKRNPEDYFLYFNRGIVLTQTGEYDEAIKAYQKSLQLNPTHYPVYRNIGIIFYVNQNYEEARKYFNRFMALSDDEETKALVRKDLENIRLKIQK